MFLAETRHWLMCATESFANQVRRTLQISVPDEDLLASRSGQLGIDSLVSVDIRSWFFKNLQVSTPVLMIMGNSTLESLVDFAVENMPVEMAPGLCSVTSPDDHTESSLDTLDSDPEQRTKNLPYSEAFGDFDWEVEATPPGDWASVQFVSNAEVSTPPNSVVLTGATGLLGNHILKDLLDKTSVKSIHCLAVRGLEARIQGQELSTDARVRYYPGNLSNPLLGLSNEEAQRIFATTDAVIHVAADTSHVKRYSDLKGCNVGSTQVLAKLCLPRRIPMHYVSSAGVSVYSNSEIFPAVSLKANPAAVLPSQEGSFGYGCSKWVCERLLERVHTQYGLPTYIYRPSTIVRDDQDATTARAQLDWVNSLFCYIRKLGKAPLFENNEGSLDLVRVQSCCSVIQDNLWKFHRSDIQLVYENLVGDKVVPLQELAEMDSHKGEHYILLPMRQWLQQAEQVGLHPGIAMLIEQADAINGPRYPRLCKKKHI